MPRKSSGIGEHEKRQDESIVSFGPYRLDVENCQLWRGVQEVRVTGKAFAMLRYFVEHPDKIPRMGKKGLEIIGGYSPENAAHQMIAGFRLALGISSKGSVA